MNLKKILPKKQFLKKCVVFSILFSLLASSFTLPFQTPISPESAYAVGNSCNTTSSNGNTSVKLLANYKGRVGGVALDQAAKFLANMSDISSAYYDATLDRIVFVGKTTTSTPQFNKDDLAVVIKSIIFDHQMPWVSIEGTNPDPNLIDAVYSTGIKNTRLGNVLIQADYKMKSYVFGVDENGQTVTSTVPGYRSHDDRYFNSPGINASLPSDSRFWLTPKDITLAKDDTSQSFIFQTATMELKTEALSTNNDPIWNSTAQDFANQFTQSYDAYAQESPILNDAKELAKIAGVIKWIIDSGVVTDFQWARDYSPKAVQTPTTFNKRLGKIYETETGFYQTSGGADLLTPNSYTQDNGTSSSLKGAAQAVPTTKEDIHWTFTKDSQQYEAVAVTADAFRTLGSYNTSEIDMSFPTVGDLTLAFQRTYSSYSGGQYGVGIGWNIYPAALYDNDPVHTFSCSGSAYPKALAFSSSRTGFESFKISDCAVGYVADDPVFHSKVFRNGDGPFTAKTKDQTEYSFSSTYQLTKIKDKNSNTITYSYDGSGKLTSIADGKGHQITPNYGGNGLISSIADWSGRIVQYTYDANGNLLTVKDPNNGVITYAYDSNSKLTTVTDRTNQAVVTNTYTDEAKLATQKDSANITNTFTYDKVNRIITATNNQTPNRTQTTKYDTKARILEQIDPLLFKLIYTYATTQHLPNHCSQYHLLFL
ncbi:hypothetical protein KKE68_05675 [Patescibacteria group bacterium]|nr:hypothetical protein [Patescibacteria group bacterium]